MEQSSLNKKSLLEGYDKVKEGFEATHKDDGYKHEGLIIKGYIDETIYWKNQIKFIISNLKEELPYKKFSELEKGQEEWIKHTKQKYNEIKDIYGGTNLYNIMLSSFKCGNLRNRCYDIVNEYMK